MKTLGFLIGLVGLAMFVYGCWDYGDLTWSNPDATTRRIYIDNPGRVWTDSIAMIVGMFLFWFGIITYDGGD